MDSRHEKVRLTIECSPDEKMFIKMLAARNRSTISECLLSFARKEMPKECSRHCHRGHVPNEETKKALRDSRNGEGETFSTLSEFWEAMGLEPNAAT
jgi:hypothetical protein